VANLKLSLILEAIDRATNPIRRIGRAIAALPGGLRRLWDGAGAQRLGERLAVIGTRLDSIRSRALGAIAAISLLGAGAGFVFYDQFIGNAAQFERFQASLEVLEGSEAKATAAMAWIQDFATKTPYELDEVTGAFVRLKQAGLDAQGGMLQAAGDAAALNTGKSVMDAVEAVADAITGENERLKEFGIVASKTGDKIVYEYAVNGRTMRRTAAANNRAMIAETIRAIWNEQYGGGMARLSRTWDGVVSNLTDTWSRWTLAVMDAGVFDWIKGRAEGLLETANRMAADGSLQRWAESTAAALIRIFEGTERLLFGYTQIDEMGKSVQVPGLFARMGEILAQIVDYVQPVVEHFGALETALGAIAIVVVGPLLAALASLAAALLTFGAALLATPVGWFLAAVALIAAAVYLVYANWGEIAAWFGRLWAGVRQVFNDFAAFAAGVFNRALSQAWEGIKATWGAVSSWFRQLWGDVRQVFAGMTEFVAGVFTLDFNRAWEGIKSAASGLVDSWGDYASGVMGALGALVSWIDSTFGTNLTGFFRDLGATLLGIFERTWSAISTATQTVMNGAAQILRDGWSGITGFFETLGATVRGIFEQTWTAIATLTQTVMAGAAQILRDAWGGISGFFTTLWATVVGAFEAARTAIQPIIDFISGAVATITSAYQGAMQLARDAKSFIAEGWVGQGADWVGRQFSGEEEAPAPVTGGTGSDLIHGGAGRDTIATPAPPPPVARAEVGGTLRIKVDGPGRVVSSEPKGGMGFDVQQGPILQGSW
jgi:hypothetical protein